MVKLSQTSILFIFLIPTISISQTLRERNDELRREIKKYTALYRASNKRVEDLKTRAPMLSSIFQARLTRTSNTPIPVNTVNAATTIYLTPHRGNFIGLYYRGAWRLYEFTQVTFNLTGTVANSNYDVFVYADGGNLALELSAAWATSTTRTDALAKQDGIYVKASDPTRRYAGTIRTDPTTADTIIDNNTDRLLWNYYNRVPRMLRVLDATNTWNYNNAAYRQAGADPNNQVNFVIGIDEEPVQASVKTNIRSAGGANRAFTVGIGLDTTTVNSAQLLGSRGNGNATSTTQAWAEFNGHVGIGYHSLIWIESCPAGANVTAYGDANQPLVVRSGIVAIVEG